MPIIVMIANLFGISVFRLVAYAALAVAISTAALAIRHHYIAKGYASAIAAVKKQDDRAKKAAEKVELKSSVCTNTNGYWDVVTQSCKLEDAP